MVRRKSQDVQVPAVPPEDLQHDPTLLDPLITAMIAKLPTHIWAKADRDKWLAMLAQVFDMVYVEPVEPAPPPSA